MSGFRHFSSVEDKFLAQWLYLLLSHLLTVFGTLFLSIFHLTPPKTSFHARRKLLQGISSLRCENVYPELFEVWFQLLDWNPQWQIGKQFLANRLLHLSLFKILLSFSLFPLPCFSHSDFQVSCFLFIPTCFLYWLNSAFPAVGCLTFFHSSSFQNVIHSFNIKNKQKTVFVSLY